MSFGTFYTHKPNPRSTATLAIAKAHGLKLDIVYADRSDQENYGKLLQINPLGRVPVFVGQDGYVLTECIPIALYITSQNDNTTLLGSTRRDYYDILKWMSFANSDLLPAQGGVILPLIGRHVTIRMDSEDSLRAFYQACRVLDHRLRAHRYLVGEQEPTLADFFVVGMIAFGFMVFHRELKAEYPGLSDWFFRVYEVPFFKEVAGPLHLLDIPAPTLPEEGGEKESGL
ncbi:glutathione S-transferase [Biscogniauxia sp. FL1348]|nr:glutathione S-transferase [Biscogniauxia sp. FL1348]